MAALSKLRGSLTAAAMCRLLAGFGAMQSTWFALVVKLLLQSAFCVLVSNLRSVPSCEPARMRAASRSFAVVRYRFGCEQACQLGTPQGGTA